MPVGIRNRHLFVMSIICLALILAFMTVAPATVEAQPASLWTVQFFNNDTLTPPVVFVEQVQYISLNWGTLAPVPGMITDNFSAVMTTSTYISGGTYRFFMRADDGARVYIDGVLQFNTYNQTQPDDLLSRDVVLSTGVHNIRIEYREVTGPAFIYFTWQDASNNPTVPDFAPGPNGEIPITSGNWTAEYYTNPDLIGSPIAILSEPTPTHDWRGGSPLLNVSTDNFSVRWTTTLNLPNNRYTLLVTADDGVRVYVDGILRIDEWHLASGIQYTQTLDLIAGNHTFVVEYFERQGLAFIEFLLTEGDVQNQTPVTNTGATLTVTTPGNLNVRNAPTTTGTTVVARITNGQTYPIVGRTADNSWWQININGVVGWVSDRFVDAINTSNVPVTDSFVQEVPTLTGYQLRVTADVNMRSTASTRGSILAVIPRLTAVDIVGRNSTGTWVKVYYDGVAGWVNADFVTFIGSVAMGDLPIVE